MNIGTRSPGLGAKRKFPLVTAVAILAVLGLIALGVAAWNDAGVQTVTDQTIAVPLPELGQKSLPEAGQKSLPEAGQKSLPEAGK